MATFLRTLTVLVFAVAAAQVAFATYTYYPPCSAPHAPQYGGYGPRKSHYSYGSKIKYYCNDGYVLHGASWTVCGYNNKGSFWNYPAPVCKPIKCHDIDDIRYGGIRRSGKGPGSTVEYYCNKGYKLVGHSLRKCRYDGSWDGKVPVCKPIICLKLDDIPYGSAKLRGNTPGSKAYYYCNKGYKLVGDSYRECQYDGYWGGKAPVCKPIYCPVPDGIKYGVVRLDDKDRKPDSKVHYQCNKGYRLYGNPWRKCQYDGYWGGKAPVCKPIYCPVPDGIKYGVVRLDDKDRKPDSKVHYQCNKGYRLYGNPWRKCQYDGYWGGKAPVCKPIYCPVPDGIKYGVVRLDDKDRKPDSKVHYQCNKGYRLYGNPWRKCQYDGYWGGKAPVCKPIYCPVPDGIKYGVVRLDDKDRKPDSKVHYQCNKGYRLYGNPWRKCQYDGYWGGKAPVCKPIYCPVPDGIKYGVVRLDDKDRKPDSKVHYQCNKGYRLYGNPWRKCQYDGYWGGKAPVCKPIYCPVPDGIKYGVVRLDGKDRKPDSKVHYQCNKGYRLYGNPWRKCQYDGYWGGKAPVCKPIYCPVPDGIKYGVVRLDDKDRKPDSKVHYHCNKGYRLYGNPWRKCQYDGYWGGKAPVCKPIYCPTLDDIKYGGVSLDDKDRKADSKAHYYCNKGYKLVGDPWRKCQYDGYWGGKEPVCKPIYCPNLYNIKYGGVKVSGKTPDSKAYYYCNKGYKLVGDPWRKCQYDGYWGGKEPVCKRIACSKLDHPQYGRVKVNDYYPSSKAYYSCDDGYYLSGLTWRKCLADGSWYGKPPVCLKRTLCPHPPAPKYGQVKVTSYTPLSKAYYSCDHGYKLYGLQWRKCLHDGSWYGKVPTCHPVKY